MSNPFGDGPNPYSPAQLPPVAAPVPPKPFGPLPTRLDYMRAINYALENPNWMMNALWCFLCHLAAQIIPIIPQMVLTGYQFEIMDDLLATGGARYPDFNPNRLAEYLTRGVWPVLAAIVISLVWVPLFLIYLFGAIGGVAAMGAAGGDEAGPIFAVAGVTLAIVLGVILFGLLILLMTPVVIRAGITQSFGAAFDFGWIMDFLGKMWLDVLAATLVMAFAALGITLVTCGIGAFVLIPFMAFIGAHFWYQYYAIYLSRGGIPVMPPAPMTYALAPPAPMPMPSGYPPKPPI